MRVELFDFDLPKERIALRPASPRDAARMLVVGRDELVDGQVSDLPRYLRSGDILVMNDTRVIPARLIGRRGDGKIEVTLHQQVDARTWKAFARPAKKLKVGSQISFADGLAAEVTVKGEGGEVTLSFNRSGAKLRAALEVAGVMPLPPYIASARAVDDQDRADYQTLYAAREGAVAAPTAGLHFTPHLLQAIDALGVKRVTITLHVGAGTFLPVKAEDTAEHKMHAEWGEVTAEVANTVNATRAAGGRVIAVGTTSLRLLESAADEAGRLHPYTGETAIFITPGYRFKIVDVLMTNFHLPRSTLFMLVSAFAGLERMQAAYAHAIADNYRFYSYGDACLLYREAA
ncbi:MAG: tRNA preQ1(34) S-adenosylmethionine ribosyltransferase-isomerase QueA [Sphingomonadales bacterium]|nr:tRNA preQ1(34) S-adenosylmethionine ribosyltransferase-isomerase QueA [Sphingomonadales bacterium]